MSNGGTLDPGKTNGRGHQPSFHSCRAKPHHSMTFASTPAVPSHAAPFHSGPFRSCRSASCPNSPRLQPPRQSSPLLPDRAQPVHNVTRASCPFLPLPSRAPLSYPKHACPTDPSERSTIRACRTDPVVTLPEHHAPSRSLPADADLSGPFHFLPLHSCHSASGRSTHFKVTLSFFAAARSLSRENSERSVSIPPSSARRTVLSSRVASAARRRTVLASSFTAHPLAPTQPRPRHRAPSLVLASRPTDGAGRTSLGRDEALSRPRRAPAPCTTRF